MLNKLKEVSCICVLLQEFLGFIKEKPETNVYNMSFIILEDILKKFMF